MHCFEPQLLLCLSTSKYDTNHKFIYTNFTKCGGNWYYFYALCCVLYYVLWKYVFCGSISYAGSNNYVIIPKLLTNGKHNDDGYHDVQYKIYFPCLHVVDMFT